MSTSALVAILIVAGLLFCGLLWFATKLYWLYTVDEQQESEWEKRRKEKL